MRGKYAENPTKNPDVSIEKKESKNARNKTKKVADPKMRGKLERQQKKKKLYLFTPSLISKSH